ncbi:uncharacterized protein LOC124163989 [Ischnura elegans]|uniref:uncharacterized protein LOC124163989 n=1 Tax=Ischnura elegans TaxID=197161 RepID=UPI001ED8B014|nr:uncharacterized protein LOC124163989 [Ischnura elegans]
MITFLKAVEGLLCIRGSTSDPDIDSTAKVSVTIDTVSKGFELVGEFGWSLRLDEIDNFVPPTSIAGPQTSDDESLPANISSARDREIVRGRADWFDCSVDGVACSSRIVSVPKRPKRRRTVWRRAPSPPPHLPPLRKWPALYMLEALLFCAREDPNVSVTLALDMHETDSVISREVRLIRDSFLRHTSFHGIRLCKMTIESSDLRMHLQTITQEIEEDVRRVERLIKNARRLRTEILECRCSDMLLTRLNTKWERDLRKKTSFILQKYPVKKLIKCY